MIFGNMLPGGKALPVYSGSWWQYLRDRAPAARFAKVNTHFFDASGDHQNVA